MTNSEQRRLTNWRLKLLQAADEAGNVARTCRAFRDFPKDVLQVATAVAGGRGSCSRRRPASPAGSVAAPGPGPPIPDHRARDTQSTDTP